MPIGTSEGEQHETEFDFHLAQMGPGEWDVNGPQYNEHYKDPANAPPEGDEAWMGLTDAERKAHMWSTPVAKSADAAWPETPEQRRKALDDMLEERPSWRAKSGTEAFKEFEMNLPKGTSVYHLKDGTTIFHRPKQAPALTS